MVEPKDNDSIGWEDDSFRQSHSSGLILFVLGIIVFSTFVSMSDGYFALALGGLVIAIMAMTTGIRNLRHLPVVFGFGRLNRYGIYFLLIAAGGGVALGSVYRDTMAAGFLPGRVASIAFLVALAGAVEELLFRGYLQSNIRSMGIFWSVTLAVLAHLAYKFMLFYSFNPGTDLNLSGLVFWTLLTGVFCGILKEYSRSTLFPILAHAVYDIIVYGDRILSPWWVWA